MPAVNDENRNPANGAQAMGGRPPSIYAAFRGPMKALTINTPEPTPIERQNPNGVIIDLGEEDDEEDELEANENSDNDDDNSVVGDRDEAAIQGAAPGVAINPLLAIHAEVRAWYQNDFEAPPVPLPAAARVVVAPLLEIVAVEEEADEEEENVDEAEEDEAEEEESDVDASDEDIPPAITTIIGTAAQRAGEVDHEEDKDDSSDEDSDDAPLTVLSAANQSALKRSRDSYESDDTTVVDQDEVVSDEEDNDADSDEEDRRAGPPSHKRRRCLRLSDVANTQEVEWKVDENGKPLFEEEETAELEKAVDGEEKENDKDAVEA